MIRLIFALLLVSSLSVQAQSPEALSQLAQTILDAMDLTVDPCNDFYNFSCGSWIANATIPSDATSIDRAFTTIGDFNKKVLREIVTTQQQGSNQRINMLFDSCMDTAALNETGDYPISYLVSEFIPEMLNTSQDLGSLVGLLHSINIPAFFSFYVDIDPGNPEINIISFDQAGLNLPDPSLYDDDDLMKLYKTHIKNMFEIAGFSHSTSNEAAEYVIGVESAIASFTIPGDQRVNPFGLYNPNTLGNFSEQTSNLSWDSYFKGMQVDVDPNDKINVLAPSFYTALNTNMTSLNIDDLKYYLQWCVIHARAPWLSMDFVNENFDFYGKILNGQDEQSPREDVCVGFVDSALGEILGALYADQVFSAESKQAAEELLESIEAAMKADIEAIDWMDDTTRAAALKKLSLVYNMIGYPPNPDNYTNVAMNSSNFFGNMMAATRYSFNQNVQKIGQPSDRQEWSMTADTVNAYYDPSRNEMVFPAAILQSPYFNLTYPRTMRFGGAGMIMGHELTHGFDDQGRDYDGTGKLTNWWAPETSKKFDQKAACVINQYSQFEPLPGYHLNGNLTQGENIADMGGVKNSFNAFLTTVGNETAGSPSFVSNLTEAQLFFVSFAQGWCSKRTPESAKVRILTDPHSPPRFRVLGPLMNLPQFSEVFQCPANSPMNPSDRCEVW